MFLKKSEAKLDNNTGLYPNCDVDNSQVAKSPKGKKNVLVIVLAVLLAIAVATTTVFAVKCFELESENETAQEEIEDLNTRISELKKELKEIKENKPNENGDINTDNNADTEDAVDEETPEKKPSQEPVTPQNGLVLDNAVGEGEWDQLPDSVDVNNKGVVIHSITQINFKAEEVTQNYTFKNDKKNDGICFMQFVIYLDKNSNGKVDDSDEQIYQSGLVKPGYEISSFTITRPLSAGTYDAVVLVQPYTLDNQTQKLNNAVFKVNLVVE